MFNWAEIQTMTRDRQAEIERETERRNRRHYTGYTIRADGALIRAARRLMGAVSGLRGRRPAQRSRRTTQRGTRATQPASGEAIVF